MSNELNSFIEIAKNGDGKKALSKLEMFVKDNPKNESAIFLLSSWLFQSMEWESSANYMESLLTISPTNKAYIENAIGMYLQMSDFKKALNYQEKLVKIDEKNDQEKYKLGMLYHRLFDFDSALKVLKELEIRMPDQPQLLGVIADILHGFGDFKNAIIYYNKILAIDSHNEAAFNGIVKSSKFKHIDSELVSLSERILNNPSVSKEAKAQVHFSLGKMYDDCKEFEKSWSSYTKANEIQSKLFPYNHQSLEIQIAKIKSIYNKHYFTNELIKGDDSVSPIFIVGMPRSGTTLLEQVLEHSGNVCAGGESLALNKAINKRFYNIRYPEELNIAPNTIFKDLAGDYINYFKNCHLNGDKRSIDKLPGNFLHLGLLKKMFPNMKVINLSRNKLDCSLSIFFQMFSNHMTFTSNLKHISSFYDTYIDTMKYWNSIFPENIFNLEYEDFVQNFESNTKQLFKFLELDWNENVGNFVESKNSVQTPSSWQVRQGINSKSVGRSENYKKYLNLAIET